MNNFEFYIPTRIVFGMGTLDTVGSNVALYGKRALLASPLAQFMIFTMEQEWES